MANPYDQFTTAPKPQDKVAPVPLPPEAPITGAAATAPAAPGANPYDNPAVLATDDGKLSADQFSSQLYDRLNRGDKPADIVQWSHEAGFPIDTEGKAGEAFYKNIEARDAALHAKRKGTYGRVVVNPASGGDESLDINDVGAFLRKAGNVPVFNFGDEAMSGAAALAQTVKGDGNLGDNYRKNWLALNTQDQIDDRFHPAASNAGEVTGMGLSMALPGAVYDRLAAKLAPKVVGRATKLANIAVKSAVGAGTGAAAGATTATGEGSPDDRFANTEGGAVVGAGIGAAFPLVAEALGRLARPIRERIFPNSARAAGDRFAMSNDELAQTEAELQRQHDLGLNPSFFDAAPERVRSRIGGAGVHDSAREDLQRFAAQREVQLPERVQKHAEAVIQPETPAGVDASTMRKPETMKANLDEFRGQDLDARLDPIRNNPVPLNDDVMHVLATREGQKAIDDAIGIELDPDARRQLENLGSMVAQFGKLPPNLGDAARQQIIKQLFNNTPFNINAAEKISRSLFDRAKTSGAPSGVLNAFGKTVRDAAKQDPEFAAAMASGQAQHQAEEAVDFGSGMSNASIPSEDFVPTAAALPSQPTAKLPPPAGAPVTAAPEAPSNRDLARVGAAATVRDQAGKGPSEAMNLAKQFYDSPEQQRKAEALLGGKRGAELSDRMRGEVERVFRASRQATKEGPASDRGSAMVESMANALYRPTSPVPWAREVSRFLHRIGMSERDAKWMVSNSIDEAQGQKMVDMLKKHGVTADKAAVYAQEFRDSLVKYMTQTEGGAPTKTTTANEPSASSDVMGYKMASTADKAAWGKRGDGSAKGSGWLGPLRRPDGGLSTEISVGVPANEVGGSGNKDVEIPLMVPGLTKSELDYLMTHDPKAADFQRNMPKSIRAKAADHARDQIKKGASPFR